MATFGGAFVASTAQIGTGAIENDDVATAAAIARTKLADGTASHVLINTGAGVMSSEASLAIARGGTALTAAPTNGQLAIGNGTNYTLATLTQGSGMTITNGAGTITLAASAFNDFGAMRAAREWVYVTAGDATFAANYDILNAEMDISVSASAGADEVFMRTNSTQWTLSGTSRTFSATFNGANVAADTIVNMSAGNSATTLLDSTQGMFFFNNGAGSANFSHCRTVAAGPATDTDVTDVTLTASTAITIQGTSTTIEFTSAGSVIASHTTQLPTSALYLKTGVYMGGNNAGDIDMTAVTFV